jgi:hypothetical protein
LTVPLTVPELCVIELAAPVVTVGGEGVAPNVVNCWGAPAVVPAELVATSL